MAYIVPAGRVAQPSFNQFTLDLIDVTVGEPQGSQSPSFSQASTHSHCYSKPTDGLTAFSACVWTMATFSHGAPPTGTRLISRHADCLVWLERVGLTIEGDRTEAIFYSLTRARPDTHGHPRQCNVGSLGCARTDRSDAYHSTSEF